MLKVEATHSGNSSLRQSLLKVETNDGNLKREDTMMTMMMRNLAILVVVSQAGAFTMEPQSRSSLIVSYLLLF
jgi:hypothetical protein